MEHSIFMIKYNKEIKKLTDQDRNIRQEGLLRLLNDAFPNLQSEELQIKYELFRTLLSPLLYCIGDKIEKNRNLALKILISFINLLELDDEYNTIIPTLLGRINTTPYPETCILLFKSKAEELRQQLIRCLEIILLKNSKNFHPFISELALMIGKLLIDTCPEVKELLSLFISKLCPYLKSLIGGHSKQIVTALCKNITHQHNKIRKITLIALSDILLCEHAGKFFEEAVPSLKKIMNDKNSDVRKEFIEFSNKLITNFNIIYLRKYEPNLTIYLLNGLSDQNEDIRKVSHRNLEVSGEYRKKFEEELEKDISDPKDLKNVYEMDVDTS